MINKRFLVPVLALVAVGLPVRASIVAYCMMAGRVAEVLLPHCNGLAAADTYASVSPITFGPAIGVLTGNLYTDDLTGVMFQAAHNMTDPGALDTQNSA